MKTEQVKLIKNISAIVIATLITGLASYFIFVYSKENRTWLFPVFSIVSGVIWLILGNYTSDTKSLITALKHTETAAAELKTQIEGYRADVQKNEKLIEFKQKLFKIFRGPRARLFGRNESVVAIFRKDGGKKYAARVDDILTRFGFYKHSLMNIRIASNITYEQLLAAKKEIHDKIPDVNDFYFIRIPHPGYFVPVNFGKRVQQFTLTIPGLQPSEDEFDKALLTKEIDINEWLNRIPLTHFLSAYDQSSYPDLDDILLKEFMKKHRLNLGTLSQVGESNIKAFLSSKNVRETDAINYAQQLGEAFKMITSFVRIVEDHTFIPP